MSPEPNTIQKMGKSMAVLTWISFFILVGLFFHEQLESQRNPNQLLQEGTFQQVSLKRNRAGHYIAPGYLNGVQVEFLLDSGATWLSIPERIATQAGLAKQQKTWVSTANGRIQVFRTVVSEVRLGGLAQQNVEGLINPAEQGQVVLLGMNFLKHYRWEQSGDTLVLSVP